MDWQRFLSDYSTIALVANSEAADLEGLRATLPADTLYVFFNKAERVIDGQFDRDSVLVARSGRKGPSIVLKNELEEMAGLFAPGALKLVVQLRTADIETLLDAGRFGAHKMVDLDLRSFFATTYPAHKTPSSGYAMAVWFHGQRPDCQLVLSGFTSFRSNKWVVFDSHAWTYEQLVLRMLVRQGRLDQRPALASAGQTVQALKAQFPDVPDGELLLTAFEVLGDRLEHTNVFLDRLWSMTRFSRGGYNVYEKTRSLFRRHRT